jgi:hypothetical protein
MSLMIFGAIMGLAFAGLATWVSLARGKALEKVAGANRGPDRDTLMVQVADKFKIQTNSQIVALYLIAAFVAIAPLRQVVFPPSQVPATRFWVYGTFGNYSRSRGSLCVRPADASIDDSGEFRFPLVLSSNSSSTGFATDSPNYQPLSIAVELQPQFQTGTISEVVSGVGTRLKADFDYGTDEINIRAPINLSFDTPPASPPPMVTTPQPIPAALKKASQEAPFPMPSTTTSP